MRVATVVGAWLVARVWADTNTAAQLGWTLEYAGVVAISLVVSCWFYLFLIDFSFSVIWLVLTWMSPPDPDRDPYLYWFHQGVELANRQLAHSQTFLIWMGVLLPCTPHVTFQLPALLALALVGPALLDWLTQLRYPTATRASGELQHARRPLIYAAAILGLGIIVARSADQWPDLLRVVVAFALVMAIRFGRHVRRRRHVRSHKEHVAQFRRDQRRLTRGVDVALGPVFLIASVVGVLGLSLWMRYQHDQVTRERLDGPPPDPERCVPEPGGPADADLTMFLVADSQVHELAGHRFPGQTELADLLVPSAVRPVELDMLSALSVAQLQRAFTDVVRNAGDRPVYWAHLGDFADLSCEGELTRANQIFSAFATPRITTSASAAPAQVRRPKLAGIAPGNHDMSFTGNFYWSPYWLDACKSTRANKRASNALLGHLLDPAAGVISEHAQISRPDRSPWWSWLAGSGGLVTVSTLGTVVDHQQRRSVVAIFIDTSDDASYDWGIAGLFGTYSAYQDERLRRLVQGLKVENPLWIVLAHHPLGELTGASRDRLENTLAWLDDARIGPTPHDETSNPREPRLLAFIAAHTHRAESHRVCIARRVVREIVIGSTIDPPQQGAVLEIGTNQRGQAALRVKTVPTVARQGFTCGTSPSMIDAQDCQRIIARLQRDPSCEPLFEENTKTARDCSELEQRSTLAESLRELMTSSNPVEPAQIQGAQKERARRLMTCVCRTSSDSPAAASAALDVFDPPVAGRCDPLVPTDDPLDEQVFAARIDARITTGGDEALTELACLSWAASVQQQHKAKGMTFASALRCAFDDRTIPAAQESVAALDVQPCQ